MKLKEIYEMKVERSTRDLYEIVEGPWIAAEDFIYDIIYNGYNPDNKPKNEKIDLDFVKDVCFDGRRVWQMIVVKYEGKPFGLIQMAGREGRDGGEMFVSDKETYDKAMGYLAALAVRCKDIYHDINIVNEEDESDKYDHFYSYNLKTIDNRMI